MHGMNYKVEHCRNNSSAIMQPGMVFTIEPILVEGSRRIAVWEDGWTAVTLDGSRLVTDRLQYNV